jgi:hypothetical protein
VVRLYAVDEGVLSLTGYETPDALAFFNQPRGLAGGDQSHLADAPARGCAGC